VALIDDGDLIRGLGYVVLYAAYLEEAIDECVDVLLANKPIPEQRIRNQQTSQKVKYICNRLDEWEPLSDELLKFRNGLQPITDILEDRNLVIHGRIYATGSGDILKPARRGLPEKSATSAELYSLANALGAAQTHMLIGSMFGLPRRILRTIG
jgi:hypothetical protein